MLATLWARLAAGAVAILAVAGLLGYAVHYERQVGAAAVVTASQEAARKEGGRRLDKQSENLDELARLVARQRDADVRGAALDQRLRDAAASGRLAPRPSAAGSGPAGKGVPPAACVSADVLGRIEQAARDAARYADCLRSGGELCAADYDALTP